MTDDAKSRADADGSVGHSSGDEGADALAMDPEEAAATFLEDRDLEDYPAVLRLTARPEAAHRRDTLERLARWQDGESVPHVVNFQDPADLRAVLTDRRVALLRTVMTDPPASIRALADRVGRDVKSVHGDLAVLADYEIVHFQQDGRAKRPVVPYERVVVSVELGAGGESGQR